MNPWLLLIGGLGVLTLGARGLVSGGSSLALRFGVTPLVIGLTVMAYGTSAPELVVSAEAALRDRGAIALGNVIGSNVCNIALILGICALLRPLTAHHKVVSRETPILIGVSVLAMVLLLDRHLGRFDGIVMLAVLAAYSWYIIRAARRDAAAETPDPLPRQYSLGKSLFFTLGGLALLIVGAEGFVDGAVTLARSWGWSELLIGLTVIAVGTSMPELALSTVATLRNESDVALGNVVGSCLFNILGILGIVGVMRPTGVPELHLGDLAVMVATTLALLPLLYGDRRITRWEGAVLLVCYAGYTWWMFQRGVA